MSNASLLYVQITGISQMRGKLIGMTMKPERRLE